jgi:hypothetical protein
VRRRGGRESLKKQAVGNGTKDERNQMLQLTQKEENIEKGRRRKEESANSQKRGDKNRITKSETKFSNGAQ